MGRATGGPDRTTATTVAAMTVSLRDRNRRAAMDQVRRVAFDLMSVHGFSAVTVEQIAAQSSVSPSTVYRYFGTKEALVPVGRSPDQAGRTGRSRRVPAAYSPRRILPCGIQGLGQRRIGRCRVGAGAAEPGAGRRVGATTARSTPSPRGVVCHTSGCDVGRDPRPGERCGSPCRAHDHAPQVAVRTR